MVSRVEARSTRNLVTGLMALAFLLACGAALRPWAAQWTGRGAPPDQAARRALSIDPGNDRLTATLATLHQYSLLLRDYPTALSYYHSTLRSNPLDSASWLHLGKLYQKLERHREADRALRLALQLASSDSRILWETTVAYLDNGQGPEALRTLTRFISAPQHENERAAGYDLASRLASPEEVRERLVPLDVTQYAHYVKYLLDRERGDEALLVWGRLKGIARADERIDPALQLRLIDLFMAQEKFGQAHELWHSIVKALHPDSALAEANLISNGSFEYGNTLGRGFDWRIAGGQGVESEIDPSIAYAGRRSLRISFRKPHADFSSVWQVISIQPDSGYTLESHISTNGVDGFPGIHLEIIDPVNGLLARTETVSGTRGWTKAGVTFRTPMNSHTVTLRVRSGPSAPASQASSGTVWIDNVSMTKTD